DGTLTGATSSAFNITPAAASLFIVAGFPSPTVSGDSHNFTVTAMDPFGNVATGYTGTVNFTSSDPVAILPANYQLLPGDAGVQSFTATLKTKGFQSLTATDTVTPSITGSQINIEVKPRELSITPIDGTDAQNRGVRCYEITFEILGPASP